MFAYDRPLFSGEQPFRARLSVGSLLSRGFASETTGVTSLDLAPRQMFAGRAGCR
ncbi:hypothetical protein [Nocardia pneumoniae]|uniref:hypothetical protein n=1 Tax=Nocardia pneumoniae TaxID=228601 RepID=UPI0002F03580|nr:hypothetical protein [Nocardia pneumoniae]